jgi:hypothetical protein
MEEVRYCPDCQLLGEEKCPNCGGTLRQAKPNDPVMLCKADAVRASMLEPLLTQAGIPYSKVGKMGAAMVMRAGAFLEEYTFYVPLGALEEAMELTMVWQDDTAE